MIVKAKRTSLEDRRIIEAYRVDGKIDLYEDYEPAALISKIIPGTFVIKHEDFKKKYVKCDDLYRMSSEAEKSLKNSNN